MNDHAAKEERIKPRKRRVETGDQAPCQGKVEITCIMNLPSFSVPAISQYRVSALGLDDAGILNSLPRKLWECLALDESAALLGTETVLLRVGGIPDPVHEEIASEEQDEERCPEGIRVDIIEVVCEVERAMTVAKGNTGKIPEDEHKAPFLEVHVPVRRSAISKNQYSGTLTSLQ